MGPPLRLSLYASNTDIPNSLTSVSLFNLVALFIKSAPFRLSVLDVHHASGVEHVTSNTDQSQWSTLIDVEYLLRVEILLLLIVLKFEKRGE